MKFLLVRILVATLATVWMSASPASASALGDDSARGLSRALAALVGPGDAVMVVSPQGAPLVSIQADRPLIPASVLKLITVAAALDQLGEGYRFKTEFYQDGDRNLIIKGYGDPLLVSEKLTAIAANLAGLLPSYQQLILDDAYFARGLVIPGRTASEEPYDAPNGALCVNFNTVAFRREKGKWVSGEPQTPLLKSVIPRIKASGLSAGRITLAANSSEALAYTGGIFQYFLGQAGLASNGKVSRGQAHIGRDWLVWRYQSSSDLRQTARDLLEYSNNFMANQILLVMGAETFGPPATMEKGLRVLRSYCVDHLKMNAGRIVEASGISRKNRVSAATVLAALEQLDRHHRLLRKDDGRQFYKTGHLRGIRTRAGFITSRLGGRYRFAVILNTPGKTTHAIMKTLEAHLK